MRGSYLKAEVLNQPFAVCGSKMKAYMDILEDEIVKTDPAKVANDNVVYSEKGNIAVIGIDGAMYKKSFSGACGETVVSYPDIVKAIDIAEASENIETIVFRVDTPGGSVAGAEEVRYRIKASKKKTITFYENLGASGGMWIFTAADELYAAPTTWLGSIGVVVAYEKEDDDGKKVELVSKSAENKRCNLNGSCTEKMQNMINTIEDDFFTVLKENTNFEKEKLMEIFDNGGVVKAEIAKENGFIKDIRQFSVLLENLKQTRAGEASMNKEPKTIGGFSFTEENFTTLVDSREKNKTTISALNENVTALETKVEKANATLDAFKSNIKTRVMLALSHNITDAGVLTDIITAEDESKAVEMAIEAKETVSVATDDGGKSNKIDAKKEQELAVAMAKKYSI